MVDVTHVNKSPWFFSLAGGLFTATLKCDLTRDFTAKASLVNKPQASADKLPCLDLWLALNKIVCWVGGWEVFEVVVEGAVGDVGGEGGEGFFWGVVL